MRVQLVVFGIYNKLFVCLCAPGIHDMAVPHECKILHRHTSSRVDVNKVRLSDPDMSWQSVSGSTHHGAIVCNSKTV